MSSELPPNYTPGDCRAESSASVPPQLVIAPLSNEVQFQIGNLGADGETADVVGEVQLKGFTADSWDRATITLRTMEVIPSQTVELSSSEVVLWSRSEASPSGTNTLPSHLSFSIPLTTDTPQTIYTPTSSLTHSLIATLHPLDSSTTAVTKTVPIQIRRYTKPWNADLHPSPILLDIDSPVPLTVQLPRAVFRAGEMIPLYLSVPPPSRSLLQTGIQLRNVTAELVRVVEIGPVTEKSPALPSSQGHTSQSSGTSGSAGPSSSAYPLEKVAPSSPPLPVSAMPKAVGDNVHETVITRSGASCRFNPTRPIQLRLVLHSTTQSDLDMENETVPPEVDTAAGSITQSTVFHRVSFYAQVQVTFLSPANHTSTSVKGFHSVVIIPSPAQPVDLNPDLEQEYLKKNDRPPKMTVRSSDDGAPSFNDTASGFLTPAPGTTGGTGGDPPPFTAEPAGMGLPSFLESQAAASGSRASHEPSNPLPGVSPWEHAESADAESEELRFEGEGVAFGFKPEDQYDGLSHSVLIVNSPPPNMLSSVNDENVTLLAELITHGQGPTAAGGPPPPPALDDPLDLPPSIDEGFRSLTPSYEATQAHPEIAAPSVVPEQAPPSAGGDTGPPPYLGAPGAVSAEGPPAYLD